MTKIAEYRKFTIIFANVQHDNLFRDFYAVLDVQFTNP